MSALFIRRLSSLERSASRNWCNEIGYNRNHSKPQKDPNSFEYSMSLAGGGLKLAPKIMASRGRVWSTKPRGDGNIGKRVKLFGWVESGARLASRHANGYKGPTAMYTDRERGMGGERPSRERVERLDERRWVREMGGGSRQGDKRTGRSCGGRGPAGEAIMSGCIVAAVYLSGGVWAAFLLKQAKMRQPDLPQGWNNGWGVKQTLAAWQPGGWWVTGRDGSSYKRWAVEKIWQKKLIQIATKKSRNISLKLINCCFLFKLNCRISWYCGNPISNSGKQLVENSPQQHSIFGVCWVGATYHMAHVE